MASVQEHYETVLADHYTWMFGASFEDKVAEQTALLQKMGVNAPSIAVDLGCGSGFQTFALSQLGATKVYAIDTSRKLLDELDGRIRGDSVETICGDMLQFLTLVPEKADTIICMGDTVPHLPSHEAVSQLFRDVSAGLAPDGRFDEIKPALAKHGLNIEFEESQRGMRVLSLRRV